MDFSESSYSLDKTIYNHTVYECIPKSSGSTAIVVSVLALPFHVLILKVLVKDVGLSLPHHQIMFTLIISDALQTFAIACISSIAMALQLTTESFACGKLRDIVVNTSSFTIVVCSLAVITLAFERMVICMHFLKYRRIFRRRTITKLLYSYLLFGSIIATIVALTNNARKAQTSVNETTSFQILCVSFILPSSTIITPIYSRIFFVSRGRIIRVASSSDGSSLRNSSKLSDVATFRMKEMRIAFVAGVVCVAYILCMVPASILFLLELVGMVDNRPKVKAILISVMMLNTLADPFIYGFGMAQTRKILIRTMKSMLPVRST